MFDFPFSKIVTNHFAQNKKFQSRSKTYHLPRNFCGIFRCVNPFSMSKVNNNIQFLLLFIYRNDSLLVFVQRFYGFMFMAYIFCWHRRAHMRAPKRLSIAIRRLLLYKNHKRHKLFHHSFVFPASNRMKSNNNKNGKTNKHRRNISEAPSVPCHAEQENGSSSPWHLFIKFNKTKDTGQRQKVSWHSLCFVVFVLMKTHIKVRAIAIADPMSPCLAGPHKKQNLVDSSSSNNNRNKCTVEQMCSASSVIEDKKG